MALNEMTSQLSTVFGRLSLGKKISLLMLLAVTVLLFVSIVYWAGSSEYKVLYSDLGLEDAGAIVEQLKSEKVPYRIGANGSSIAIPVEAIYETRLKLASQGLPQGNMVGFEIFDNTKLGMTEFVQNVNYQRALQGELARTINRFAEVESSRVHIVLPEKKLFIEQEAPATASVVLNLRPGKHLGRSQIQAIVHLVSSSIADLDPEHVTVVDDGGKMLAGFAQKSPLDDISTDQLEIQEKVQQGLEQRVKSMLEAALGKGNAIVRLAAELDFKRRERTEERYHPDNRVVRSEQLFSEESAGAGAKVAMGIPGVGSNIAGDNAGKAAGDQGGSFQKQDRTVNYEIGKEISRVVEPVGQIRRISVAVIVDGTYKQVTTESGEVQTQYFPRTQSEMTQLENIVRRAVNLDSQRGDQIEVVNLPIASSTKEMPAPPEPEGWLAKVKGYAPLLKFSLVAIFVLMTFLFVVRPIVRWLTTLPEADSEMLKQLPLRVGELEGQMADSREALPSREQALQLIRSDPDGSIRLMRDWLKHA
jgi:flagellar M-ring protein FliF